MSRILLLVLSTALVMRAPINALGPVAEDVIETLGFGYAAYGFVAALPIFLFGLMSPFVSRLLRRFSGERLFLAGLLLLIFGCWGRGAHDPLLFIAGTLVMGFGITQLNVLMPAVIKTGFKEKWPVMMSAYAALIGLSGTAGVALSTQLFAVTADFSASLRVWAPAALPALFLLLSLRRGFVPKETAAPETSGRIASARLLFALVAITGLQAAINSTISLWLPSALAADGFTSAQAGAFVTTLLIASIAGSFAQPALSRLCPDFTVRVALSVAAFVLPVHFLDSLPLVLTALAAGFAQGIFVAESFAMPARKTDGFERLVALTGRVQCGGYVLAGVGPFLTGGVVEILSVSAVPTLLTVFALLWGLFAVLAERAE